MHMHEKRCIKRAGVAGIALRAMGSNMYVDTKSSLGGNAALFRLGELKGRKNFDGILKVCK